MAGIGDRDKESTTERSTEEKEEEVAKVFVITEETLDGEEETAPVTVIALSCGSILSGSSVSVELSGAKNKGLAITCTGGDELSIPAEK